MIMFLTREGIGGGVEGGQKVTIALILQVNDDNSG